MLVPRHLLSPVLFCLAIAPLIAAEPKPANSQRSRAPDPTRDFVIGEPISFQNLTIFPVSSRTPRTQDRFITLDQGLKDGTVEIFEKGATRGSREGAANPGANEDPFAAPANEAAQSSRQSARNTTQSTRRQGRQSQRSAAQAQEAEQDARDPFSEPANDVNELMVVNNSDKPLYLMPGEIIIGGSQDRTIGQELVIAPDGKPVPIDVFCVEHGRWGHQDEGQYASLAQAASREEPRASAITLQEGDVAREANRGKFVGSVGSLSKPARLAVQSGGGQQKVWEEVAGENAKAGVKSRSGAFTGNYAEEEAVSRLGPYIKKLHDPVAKTENVVGAIVAVNGRVESMDVFESTPLFRKLWPKLLKSYALDAANAVGEKTAKKTSTRGDALAFLQQVAQAESKKTTTQGKVAVTHGENERVLLFSAHESSRQRQTASPAERGAMGGFGGGGFGGGIHGAAFSK